MKFKALVTVLFLMSAFAIIFGRIVARAGTDTPSEQNKDSRKIDLTIYNQDFALVHEWREVQLEKGDNRLKFEDVSKELDPHSVLLRFDGKGTQPEIIGHSYDLGVKDSQGLLKHEVGKPIQLVRYADNGNEASPEQGRLLVAANGSPAVVEIDGKLYVNPEGTIVVDDKDGIPTIPQLSVQIESSGSQSSTIDLAYLTRGLSWSADYVATVSDGPADRVDLECYATVTNRTGVKYSNADINLVTGAPNRAARVSQEEGVTVSDGFARFSRATTRLRGGRDLAGFDFNGASSPQAVAEFYNYTLKKKATIHNEQLNRLLMMRRDGLLVKKDYSYRAPYLYSYDAPQDEHGRVAVAFSFVNSEQEGTGLPLPRGTIRVYDPDKSGRLRYAGASEIPETPKNKKVNVTLANAFDVTAEYKTIDSKKIGKRKIRKQVQVVLRNERANALKVRVVQGFDANWSIASASHKYVKLDSNDAQWTIDVPASGKTTLSFFVDLPSH